MAKVVFSFDDKSAKKLKNKKNILGGKGANLGEMGRLGLPVPPGFTITTDVCDLFYKNKKKLPKWSKIMFLEYICRLWVYYVLAFAKPPPKLEIVAAHAHLSTFVTLHFSFTKTTCR